MSSRWVYNSTSLDPLPLLTFFFSFFFHDNSFPLPVLTRGASRWLLLFLFFFFLHVLKKSRLPSVTNASQRYPTTMVAAPPPPPPPPPRPLLPRPPPPAPIAIASTSASVSPSPFAPRAQITKSSSSTPPHLAAKDAVHADRLAVPVGALETPAGDEDVNAHEEERLRDSPRDSSRSPIGGVQSSLAVDPPLDQDRPSDQVCPSLCPRPLFIPVCTHTSCVRVQNHPWPPPVVRHRRDRLASLKSARQKLPYSFPPQQKANRLLALPLRPETNIPNLQTLYPSRHHHHPLPHPHCHRRVLHVAVRATSPRFNKDDSSWRMSSYRPSHPA
jgi:hypothetical protein